MENADDMAGRLSKRSEQLRANRSPICCQAIVEDFDRPAYHAPMQRMTLAGEKQCAKRPKTNVGGLDLCTVHARLARQGFVNKDGTVAMKSVREDYAKYPSKLKTPFFTWLPGADPRSR